MDVTPIILSAHAAATLVMVGVIWTMQLVHYPLFGMVGSNGYVSFQRQHMRRITWIVGPAMLTEMVTAIWIMRSSVGDPSFGLAVSGLVMLILIWLSTAFLQAPAHTKLARGFDQRTHNRLVCTNWLRTALWSGRGVIALALLQAELAA